jgi:alanyl-tRNA synthetase
MKMKHICEASRIAGQGSLVTPERLRFDFNLHRGLAPDEVAQVEALVNGWVAEDSELTTREMPLAEAKAAGAWLHGGQERISAWRDSKQCFRRCLPGFSHGKDACRR